MRKAGLYSLVTLLCFADCNKSSGQCMVQPVSLAQRVSHSAYIVQGTVSSQHTYIDETTGSVNTLNKIRINFWLKNYQPREEIYLITHGGVFGNRATKVFPSLQVTMGSEYVFFLDKEDNRLGDKDLRRQQPGQWQLCAYADAQGAIIYEKNGYRDLFSPQLINEDLL